MRLLVTGASGFLGAWVSNILASRHKYQVVTQSYRTTLHSQPSGFGLKADLSEPSAVSQLFKDATPDAVIHAAALSDPNFCEENPELSKWINVQASLRIAAECYQRKIPLIFTSTDLVFDGCKGTYSEVDAANPINVYGRHKLEAESVVQSAHPQSTVVRLPWMFGIGLTKRSPFTSYLERLRSGQAISGFVDEFRSPVSYPVAAAAIVELINKAPGKVLHLGGPEVISRYDFLIQLAAFSGNDPRLVLGQKQNEVVFAARRPKDVSLISDLAYALGYQPPSLERMIKASLNQEE